MHDHCTAIANRSNLKFKGLYKCRHSYVHASVDRAAEGISQLESHCERVLQVERFANK